MLFYKCEHCGNMIAHLYDSGVRVVCCGEEMKPIEPNTSDGAGEKHVPVITVDGQTVTVTVGSVDHPMLDAHYIQWIMLETKEGRQRKTLKPGEKPVAVFALTEGDSVGAAYEYCNLHGLWKSE
ncbi:MAG: desulfoferrodoxin family protein [Erysipelotrichaceae bacterium]|nr:desulfoferrodoxin family protein [Erysipelotrichaceae bacterium]